MLKAANFLPYYPEKKIYLQPLHNAWLDHDLISALALNLHPDKTYGISKFKYQNRREQTFHILIESPY